jgi:hypothetical protein
VANYHQTCHEIYSLSNLNNNLIVSHKSPLSFTLSSPNIIMESLQSSSIVTFRKSKILCGLTKCLPIFKILLSLMCFYDLFLLTHRHYYPQIGKPLKFFYLTQHHYASTCSLLKNDGLSSTYYRSDPLTPYYCTAINTFKT